jgi:hypothetical protein
VRRSTGFILGVLLLVIAARASAEPVTLKYLEGVAHGFLVVRADQNRTIAHGELVQTTHPDGIESRMSLRFTDGSLYDETVTFSQKRVFRLLAYRLVQRGPAFSEATEVSFDRASGHYRAKVGDSDGVEGPLELPEDLHNGMTGTLLRNLPPGGPVGGHMYAFTPKPRLLRTTLRREGEDRYYVGGRRRTHRGTLPRVDGPRRPHGCRGRRPRQGATRRPFLVYDGVGAGLREVRGGDVPEGTAREDRAGAAEVGRRAVGSAVSRRAPCAASRSAPRGSGPAS